MSVRRTVDSGGVRLAVRESPGRGPAIVFVHGLGTGQRAWRPVLSALPRRTRVVTFDLRAHGASGRVHDVGWDALRGDVRAVLGGLEANALVLVGHSMGAGLALDAAAQEPRCRGVLAVEGGLAAELPPADWSRVERDMRRPVARLAMALMRLARTGPALSIAELRAAVEDYERHRGELAAVLDAVACPVTFALADRSARMPDGEAILAANRAAAREAQHAHAHVTVQWLDATHDLPLRRPRELARLIGSLAGD